jgi:hypothetical protein
VSNAGTIEGNMPQRIIDYRLCMVEKVKLNAYLNKHYNGLKQLSDSQYVAFSVLEICRRTTYQIDKNTPYDVLRGKANCQGYSFMLYVMLAKANIPCRLVYSNVHMWNEVMLGGKWVKYDVTAMDSMAFKFLK